jgi:hypothetical protein
VEHIPTETVTFDLGTTPPPVQYRLFVDLPGPLSATAATGGNLFATMFQVLTPGCKVVGYSYWCCKTGQSTAPVNFSLYQLTGPTAGALQPASHVTGPTMTQGAWNDAFLPTPVPLSVGPAYAVEVGVVDSFPFTNGFWASTGVGYTGMTNGPLQAFSDQGASNPAPFSFPQCSVGGGSSDSTIGLGSTASGSFNGWVDVLIATG